MVNAQNQLNIAKEEFLRAHLQFSSQTTSYEEARAKEEVARMVVERRTNQHRRLMAARVAGGRQLWEMLDELQEEHNENSNQTEFRRLRMLQEAQAKVGKECASRRRKRFFLD